MSAAPAISRASRAGAVDMTAALRSPGSALKPFIYALAFENGVAHPETLVDDRPSRFGAYAPENFDLSFQGTVTARRALQLSLNVPAVELLAEVGPARFLARLRQGRSRRSRCRRRRRPGLAVGLGGLGITLADLTRLYAGLARGGDAPGLVRRLDGARAGARRGASPSRSRPGTSPTSSRGAAARERARRPHRLQDRHLLRLSATPGRSASTATRRSGSGSDGRTAPRCRVSSGASPPRRSCSTPMPGSAASRRRCRCPRMRSSPRPRRCRRRCGTCARTCRRPSPRRRARRSRSPIPLDGSRVELGFSARRRGGAAGLEGGGRRAAPDLARQRRAGDRADAAPAVDLEPRRRRLRARLGDGRQGGDRQRRGADRVALALKPDNVPCNALLICRSLSCALSRRGWWAVCWSGHFLLRGSPPNG